MLYPMCSATLSFQLRTLCRGLKTVGQAVVRKAYKCCTPCVVRRFQLHTLCRGFLCDSYPSCCAKACECVPNALRPYRAVVEEPTVAPKASAGLGFWRFPIRLSHTLIRTRRLVFSRREPFLRRQCTPFDGWFAPASVNRSSGIFMGTGCARKCSCR